MRTFHGKVVWCICRSRYDGNCAHEPIPRPQLHGRHAAICLITHLSISFIVKHIQEACLPGACTHALSPNWRHCSPGLQTRLVFPAIYLMQKLDEQSCVQGGGAPLSAVSVPAFRPAPGTRSRLPECARASRRCLAPY